MEIIRKAIREIPDFPKPGILFYDITTVLMNPVAYKACIDALAEKLKEDKVDVLAVVESRGFIFGSALAYNLKKPLVLLRKPGKLPYKTRSISYALEYGQDTLEIHEDAVTPGQRVAIIDDLLATGGTAAGTVKLIQEMGALVIGCYFVIELGFLAGRTKLGDTQVFSLVTYD